MTYPNVKLNPDWVTGVVPIDSNVVTWLESFGSFLAKDKKEFKDGKEKITKAGISTSQIRKFFGEVKKIQADFDRKKGDIVMLVPKLAYAVGRDYNSKTNQTKSKIQDFNDELKKGIMAVNEDKKKFMNLVKIIEGIVAFHRAEGGKSN